MGSGDGRLVKSFRELRVYRQAFDLAMAIHRHTKTWPRDERFSLVDQIRRSSRSVFGSIAEAWRKRRYVAHFRSKLSDADSEGAETQAWLEFASALGYMEPSDFADLDAAYERVSAGLSTMISDAERWCHAGSTVREPCVAWEMAGEEAVTDEGTVVQPPHRHTATRPYPTTRKQPARGSRKGTRR
ncbi:MAG: four helix bundle protein [Verrucomicrobia bacterium]|nr:four helix bundle protein [Verrucomicrobiota bacterium]